MRTNDRIGQFYVKAATRWRQSDNTPERLKRNAAAAGAASRVEVQVADMRELPFPDASFDGAVNSFAIDHLARNDVPRALREAARVPKPHGQVPDHEP